MLHILLQGLTMKTFLETCKGIYWINKEKNILKPENMFLISFDIAITKIKHISFHK
jgi:hypothetical protein